VHEWSAVLDHCTRMLMWFDRYLTRAPTGGQPPDPD